MVKNTLFIDKIDRGELSSMKSMEAMGLEIREGKKALESLRSQS